MNMVRINVPIHTNVSRDDCQRFLDAHLPAGVPFRVEYNLDSGTADIILPAKHAAPVNVLYYSIPDWIACES